MQNTWNENIQVQHNFLSKWEKKYEFNGKLTWGSCTELVKKKITLKQQQSGAPAAKGAAAAEAPGIRPPPYNEGKKHNFILTQKD